MGIVTDEKNPHEHDDDDDGIVAGGALGKIRLPKSIADAMAPASVWLMYAIAASVIILALCFGISRVVESLK